MQIRLAVEQQPATPLRVGPHAEGAQPEVAGDLVIAEPDFHVVQEGILGAPPTRIITEAQPGGQAHRDLRTEQPLAFRQHMDFGDTAGP